MPHCLKRHGTILLILLVVCLPLPVAALDVPALQGRVNDYAGMLAPATERHLDAALQDLERSDSTQIVVLTIASLEGDSLEDFSIRVAEQWRIGHKGLDNGAILLIAKADRKLRIEVGYGLEGRLTDLMAGRIIANVIVPYFKNGQIDALFWDQIGLYNLWRTRRMKGHISDMAIADIDGDGQKELVFANVVDIPTSINLEQGKSVIFAWKPKKDESASSN